MRASRSYTTLRDVIPIGQGGDYQRHLNRYKSIIKPAIEKLRKNKRSVFRSVRADFVEKTGSITKDLLNRLYRADVVIADLTELNPNVFYELGVRHALRSGTILMALKGTALPFDVGDLRVIRYEDRVGGEKAAIPEIQKLLMSLSEENRQHDSPVFDAIPELANPGPAKENEARIAALRNERDTLRAQLEIAERTSLSNQAALEAVRERIEKLSDHLSNPKRGQSPTDLYKLLRVRTGLHPSPSVKQISRKSADPNAVFVIMPFSKDLEPIYDVIRKAAISVGFLPMRADEITSAGTIIDQIFEQIVKSGLIVADLSHRNPNVMYEIGVAHMMAKPVILLAQRAEDIPFDMSDIRAFIYGTGTSPDRTEKLMDYLLKAFSEYRHTSSKM